MLQESLKKKITLNTVLIISAAVAAALGITAYLVIFGVGTQVVQPGLSTSTVAAPTSSVAFVFPTSTASSSASSTGISSGTAASSTGTFSSTFSAPYPVSWNDGESSFAVSGATLNGNELTLFVNVTLGTLPECVPINIRLISDEQGDTAAPDSPNQTNFPLGTSTCEGDANAVYPNQPLTFTVDPTNQPFLFMTGGTSNIYFEVSTTTTGGINAALPQQSG